MICRTLLCASILVVLTGLVSAQDRVQAYLGARIIPIGAEVIEDGVLIVQDGKILAVGPALTTPVPGDAQRHDVRGKVIMPGLICTHSHVGGGWGGDSSEPIQPETSVLDSIDVRNAGFRRVVAGGLTTLNVMPGSGHLMSGQTLYLKLRPAGTIDEMLIRLEDGRIAGGMKMANGTNSQKDPPFPGTRARSASLIREAFAKAEEYREKVARAGGDAEKLPPRDLGLEAMIEVLDGKRVVHHHTHRHDDILTVLRLAREIGFKVVLHHVSEAWKVTGEIAAAGAPCSIILLDSPGGKLEATDLHPKNARALEEAGVLTAFHTDDWITDSRLFFRMAAMGVRWGMSREKALEGLTLAGAKMLELDDRIGSLAAGKDADFILLSGDPLSVYTKVLGTWVEGDRVFDRSNPQDRLHATGGLGAGERRVQFGCCLGEGDDR